MEREHCIYKAREHSSRSGERTLYPVAIIKKYRSDKRTEKIIKKIEAVTIELYIFNKK